METTPVETPPKVNILEEALKATNKRCDNYGTMPENAETISRIASAITRTDISVEIVFAVLVSLKLQRSWDDPRGLDHFIDLTGWARGWADSRQEDAQREKNMEAFAETMLKGIPQN